VVKDYKEQREINVTGVQCMLIRCAMATIRWLILSVSNIMYCIGF